jgi:hypothetical protein
MVPEKALRVKALAPADFSYGTYPIVRGISTDYSDAGILPPQTAMLLSPIRNTVSKP